MWSTDEDEMLLRSVELNAGKWRAVATCVPGKTAKQCRERYKSVLDPSLIRTSFTPQEDRLLHKCVLDRGTRWAEHRNSCFPHRSDNALKNRWNTIKKRYADIVTAPATRRERGARKVEPTTEKKKTKVGKTDIKNSVSEVELGDFLERVIGDYERDEDATLPVDGPLCPPGLFNVQMTPKVRTCDKSCLVLQKTTPCHLSFTLCN